MMGQQVAQLHDRYIMMMMMMMEVFLCHIHLIVLSFPQGKIQHKLKKSATSVSLMFLKLRRYQIA